MTQSYDVIVIGLGGMGAAAACAVARRGKRVLGIEQYDLAHELGSSGAGNRIYRFAYFLDPAYVPLMRHAHQHWARLERDAGERLLFKTGGLDMGLPSSNVVKGAKAACLQHDLAHEVLSARELMRRVPAWRLPEVFEAVYQAEAGLLPADKAIQAHVKVALRHGADLRFRTSVTDIQARGDRAVVTTSRGTFEAGQVILAAGPWTQRFAPALAAGLTVERQVVAWFEPRDAAAVRFGAFPVFIIEDDTGNYYGFPEYGAPGLKIGRHGHRHEATTPDKIARVVDDDDLAILQKPIGRYLPTVTERALARKTCMYTNTPDNHFVIDSAPDAANAWIAAGFSGHGYKFCAGIGEILADLALDGRTKQDISRFNATRRALRLMA